jgi:hypothetical protein
MVKMPERLRYMTADEVAETVSYKDPDRAIYNKLWEILEAATNPTPLGGDGTDGTVECPGERLDARNDDKTPHWWAQLTEEQQGSIAAGVAAEDAKWTTLEDTRMGRNDAS